MTPHELRECCLGMTGAVEEFPFAASPGLSVFKVGGKCFAFTALDEEPLRVTLKCAPEDAARLRADHPAVAPGYHLNKRHWITVTLDGGLPARMVRELVEDSWDLVVAGLPRARRLRLDRP